MRIFGKRKCKFIAIFSATMVTSLPSLSLSLSLSLYLSLSLRAYLTHNIGSASALPIINILEEVIKVGAKNNMSIEQATSSKLELL